MDQIELFNSFTVLGTIQLYAKKWLLNWIISITQQYLKPINCELIKLLVLDINTWNHSTVCKWKWLELWNMDDKLHQVTQTIAEKVPIEEC